MASDSAQRVPPFLAIAGEVRNLICEYALTSPEGLYSNRTIDMKSPKPLLYTLKNEDWTPPLADHGADNVHTANSEHGTNNVYSTSRGHGASNVHSTSSDHGVNNGNSASSKHNMGNVWEFNQLKYVNRQMYKETAGIEVSAPSVGLFLSVIPTSSEVTIQRRCLPPKQRHRAGPRQAIPRLHACLHTCQVGLAHPSRHVYRRLRSTAQRRN
jgi:hypothetical protein